MKGPIGILYSLINVKPSLAALIHYLERQMLSRIAARESMGMQEDIFGFLGKRGE